MPKRPRNNESSPVRSSIKRRRVDASDRLSVLSNELILKILLYLPVPSLVKCLRVCHRIGLLAGDSEIWKQKYYSRWIRPRARLIPSSKKQGTPEKRPFLSSRLANWLEHGHLVQKRRGIDWKRQYKLKHNWSKGACKVKELEVKQPPFTLVLVKLHNGIVFTADRDFGLRAWATQDHKLLALEELNLASTSWSSPTSLGIDTSLRESYEIDVTVGFENGAFRLYTLDVRTALFVLRYSRPPSSFGPVTAISPALPYLALLSDNRSISVYKFPDTAFPSKSSRRLPDPILIHSLNTPHQNVPTTLSLRNVDRAVTVSVAFVSPKMNDRWCLGLQEIHIPKPFEPLRQQETGFPVISGILDDPQATIMSRLDYTLLKFLGNDGAQPVSISYSHPYLLIINPDNTLEICLVTSSIGSLSISESRRLWGHTSAISGAEVSDCGRAVSVARTGNEVRLWDLEDILVSTPYARPKRSSIPIAPENQSLPSPSLTYLHKASKRRDHLLTLASPDVSLARGWVGFDEEQVVVLREWQPGKQVLACYDFT